MTSANVVGYQNKGTRQNFNYVTPSFRPIAGLTGEDNNEMSINEIQMDETVGLAKANFQKLTASGGTAALLHWVPKANCASYGLTCPEGLNGVWAKQYKQGISTKYREPDGSESEPNTVKVGEGVQVNAEATKTISFSGQVGEESVAFLTNTGRQNFNYFGNPFAAEISINNIQMDETVGLAKANFQKLTASGGTAALLHWVPKANCASYGLTCPEGLNGVWAKQYKQGISTKYREPDGSESEPKTVDAGEAIQLNMEAGKQYFVLCPYDL